MKVVSLKHIFTKREFDTARYFLLVVQKMLLNKYNSSAMIANGVGLLLHIQSCTSNFNVFLKNRLCYKKSLCRPVLFRVIHHRSQHFKKCKFKKSYDLPLDLLQYRRENSAEYLYS